MALHYHGLPITPASRLDELAGKHVCISYATARPSNIKWAMANAQSIMWDNGAFTFFRQGGRLNVPAFYRWLNRKLGHPNWAVVPDVIDGSVEEQRELIATWPFDKTLGAPVWHLGLPFDYLLELADNWPRICFGSSGEYWKIGSPAWEQRMDEAFDELARRRRALPWVHGLRMLSKLGDRWPLASADSVNVTRNRHNGYCAGCKSHRIDTKNGPIEWPPTHRAARVFWRGA